VRRSTPNLSLDRWGGLLWGAIVGKVGLPVLGHRLLCLVLAHLEQCLLRRSSVVIVEGAQPRR
jgi:hypothetical protein